MRVHFYYQRTAIYRVYIYNLTVSAVRWIQHNSLARCYGKSGENVKSNTTFNVNHFLLVDPRPKMDKSGFS